MLTKENMTQIMEKIENIYDYFDKKSSNEKSRIFTTYIKELFDYECQDILKAIDYLSEKSKYIPSVAEIKIEIKNQNSQENTSNINWNSSYWFENDREVCDRDNIPYYDITKGVNVPLPPYKDWKGKNK